MPRRAKFRVDRQTVAEIWFFIIFSIWQLSAILDTLWAYLDHMLRTFSGL